MKKLLTLCMIAGLCLTLKAEIRSAEEALQLLNSPAASGAMRAQGHAGALRLKETRRQSDQQTPAYYVFQRGIAEGFVVVSAETNTTTPIIGYSEEGEWPSDSLPGNVQYWLDRYAAQIEAMRAPGIRRASLTTTYVPVAPLIGTR